MFWDFSVLKLLMNLWYFLLFMPLSIIFWSKPLHKNLHINKSKILTEISYSYRNSNNSKKQGWKLNFSSVFSSIEGKYKWSKASNQAYSRSEECLHHIQMNYKKGGKSDKLERSASRVRFLFFWTIDNYFWAFLSWMYWYTP